MSRRGLLLIHPSAFILHPSETNPLAHFYPVRGADHFSILAPTTRLIAGKILRDDGPAANIAFTEEELHRPFAR
jgi:hypothetical protein